MRLQDKMPNASRKYCDYPQCASGPLDANHLPTPYVTPADLRTREEVSEDMKQHVETAHELSIRKDEAEAKKLEMEAKKLEFEVRKMEVELARSQADRPGNKMLQLLMMIKPKPSWINVTLYLDLK